MTTTLIHLSDFHNVIGKYENHAVLVNALFEDLALQIKTLPAEHVYLAFSGDIVQSGSSKEQYDDFHQTFDDRLTKLGIPRSNRIIVPGNHDICRDRVARTFVEHEGVVAQNLNEKNFNDYVLRQPNVFSEKFENYLAFQSQFADVGLSKQQVTGAGWAMSDDVGIYCLNTALCSSGGIERDGNRIVDKNRLSIDTRSLHSWVMSCKARWKILVMHHPISWLTASSARELTTILKKSFSLCLSGHEHEQEVMQSFHFGNCLVECSAPALFTSKLDQLGYSLLSIDETAGVRQLVYRQWTKHQTFVSGSSLSNTDSGRIYFHATLLNQTQAVSLGGDDFIGRYFTQKLDNALFSFSGQPRFWIDPVLKLVPEAIKDEDARVSFDLKTLIERPTSRSIKAPAQFGLTCLAHFLVKEAWLNHGKLWMGLDALNLKPHRASITEAVAKELSLVGLAHSEIACIVLDSVDAADKNFPKLLEKLKEIFSATPIICMETIGAEIVLNKIIGTSATANDWDPLYLWTLPRGHIRKIVAGYNSNCAVGDEDLVTSKLVADLEVLNLHRTPFNCLTLLKVYEIDFDDSPVNRSEMIKRVLFLLFNVDLVPTYKARPDLKDCEYVLGYFCEILIKDNIYVFSRAHFLGVLRKYCQDRFIDLEVQVVFDVLSANNILVMREGNFCFKFTFWVYYFAALRMHHDKPFADFIFENMRYANYPEIVEFYTGIDRQRDDAVQTLTSDLATMRERVEVKCGFPKNFNPYHLAQWTPSPSAVENMQIEMNTGIQGSNLPAEIKDVFADRSYDSSRPYSQNINLLTDNSFVYLRETLRAASKALRNSDYVNPLIKRRLLQEIIKTWEQLSMVLLVVMPALAENGKAAFDGSLFMLDGDFGSTFEDRLMRILVEIPANVVLWSEDDLFSSKMGPLLIDVLKNEQSDLGRHELVLLLITQRPRGWHAQVQSYIASVAKNSFYLLDVYRSLRGQYRYSYASSQTLKDMEHLISMAVTKHVTGHKDPGVKLIQKTLPKVTGEQVIPTREV